MERTRKWHTHTQARSVCVCVWLREHMCVSVWLFPQTMLIHVRLCLSEWKAPSARVCAPQRMWWSEATIQTARPARFVCRWRHHSPQWPLSLYVRVSVSWSDLITHSQQPLSSWMRSFKHTCSVNTLAQNTHEWYRRWMKTSGIRMKGEWKFNGGRGDLMWNEKELVCGLLKPLNKSEVV